MKTILPGRFKVAAVHSAVAGVLLLFCIQSLRALPDSSKITDARKRVNDDFMLADACYQALKAHPDELFNSLNVNQDPIRKSMDGARSALNLHTSRPRSQCSLDLLRQDLGSVKESLNALTPAPKSPEATAEKNIETLLAAIGLGNEQEPPGSLPPPPQTGPNYSSGELKASLSTVTDCIDGWKQNGRARTVESQVLLDSVQEKTRKVALDLRLDAGGPSVKRDCTESEVLTSLEKAKQLIAALPETAPSQYGQSVITEANGQIEQAQDSLSQFEKLNSGPVTNPIAGNGGNDESSSERLLLNVKSRGVEYLSLLFSLVVVGILLTAQLRQKDRKQVAAVATHKSNETERATLKAAKVAVEKLRSAVERIDNAQKGLAEQLATTIIARPPAIPHPPGSTATRYEEQKVEATPPVWEQPRIQEPPVRQTPPQSFTMPPQADGPVVDFNECLGVGINEAEDRFIRKYGEMMRLTCVNLQEHRNPSAILRFKGDGRGNFMVVLFRGQMLVLPAIGLNPNDSRKLLEGVFQYPSERVPVRLATPAKVESETADTFVIRERGVFERV
jgi:hypothetical protein